YLLRAVLHRARPPPRPSRRPHHEPDRRLDDASSPELHDGFRPHDPVLAPRRRRRVRRRVRRGFPKRRRHDHPHPALHAGRERVRGTLGWHRAPRTPRPHPHLEPPPPRTAPARVRRALQHPAAPPQPPPTHTRHSRRRR